MPYLETKVGEMPIDPQGSSRTKDSLSFSSSPHQRFSYRYPHRLSRKSGIYNALGRECGGGCRGRRHGLLVIPKYLYIHIFYIIIYIIIFILYISIFVFSSFNDPMPFTENYTTTSYNRVLIGLREGMISRPCLFSSRVSLKTALSTRAEIKVK